jgi:hypothetical protein
MRWDFFRVIELKVHICSRRDGSDPYLVTRGLDGK